MTERIEVSKETQVQILIERVGGDLRLRGGDRREVTAKGDNPRLKQTEAGDIRVTCDGDLTLHLPSSALVKVSNVGGDAKITDVLGALTINNVGSDLVLRNVGPLDVQNIGSDLRLKRTSGDVRIGHIGSDATVREVVGAVTLENVGADLYIRDVSGACLAEHVGGDLVLSTDFTAGVEYRFAVGGDVVCRVPPEANVRIRPSAGGEISIDAPGATTVENAEGEEIVFGTGEALVYLNAGGDIRLVSLDEDYMMAINFQLEEELEARLAGLDKIINDSLSGLDQLVSTQVERAMRKAGQVAHKAERHLEREIDRLGRGSKPKRHAFSFSFGAPPPPRPPRTPPPDEPVMDEERLLILRMVEARQITVEEAERLLSALEGRAK